MVFRGRTPAALAVACVCVSVATVGGTVRPSAIDFTSQMLPNGLRVVVHDDHSTPVASVQVWYHVGSKNEPPDAGGVAHLLERLMFKGSKNVEPDQHSTLITHAGGQNASSTTDDVTVFWNTVPSTHVPLALWLEADRMATLRFDRDVFEFERDVLKEERRLQAEQTPYARLPDIVYGHAFTVHPYKRPPLGLEPDIASLQVGKARDFYRAYYTPDNATIVVAGDVEPSQAFALARQYFGRIPTPGPARPKPAIPAEPVVSQPRRVTAEEPWPLPVVVRAHHVPADGHPDTYPLRVAAKILSDGQGARLHRSLVYEHPLALTVQAGGHFAEHPGVFYASAVARPGNTPAEVEEALWVEIDLLRTAAVSEAELARALNQLTRDAVLGRATVAQKAERLGRGATLHGDPGFGDADVDRLRAVTAADVQRVARTYFAPATQIAITIRPKPASARTATREAR
jgi:zinc protease